MTTLNGRRLQDGKYILDQELGRGGFGITYQATNQALAQTVVIKTLNDSLKENPNFVDFQRQFQDEAQRLAKFSHPNIVRVSDFFTEDGRPYIVMDYIPGQTLDCLIRPNTPLPEATGVRYISQVGAALGVVHQHGLLHRDVKPQNIILRQGTQEVVLIDFGIAREFTPGVTQTHTGIISAGYAPIEQYLVQEKRTPATDVYGLAATLYTLLTAQVPTPAPLRDRRPLPPPRDLRPELSERVSQAVMRGMALEAHHRSSGVEEWLALLPHVQGDRPAVAKPTGSTSQVATIRVAPPLRSVVQRNESTESIRSAAERSGYRQWLGIGLVGVGLLILFGMGLTWLSTQSPLTTPLAQPDGPPSPSPAVQNETLPPPAADEFPIPPTSSQSATTESLKKTESIPAQTEILRDPEAEARAAEQEREAQKRAAEQEREERKRQAEQEREERKRQAEQEREAQQRN